MSEEKPTFKVTDRRLFNADGTPRADIPRAEEKPEAAPESHAPAAAAGAGASPESSAPATESAPAGGGAPRPGDEAEPPGRREQSEAASRHDPAAEDEGEPELDPTPFANLVMFIAQPAAVAMGMTEYPGHPPGEVDLPLAKHCIDLLALVKEKTHGNLGKQEQQIVDGLLAELRMQYVSLTSAPRPAPPRGFTGSDITGGR